MNTAAVMCIAFTKHSPSRTPLLMTRSSTVFVIFTNPRRFGISNQSSSRRLFTMALCHSSVFLSKSDLVIAGNVRRNPWEGTERSLYAPFCHLLLKTIRVDSPPFNQPDRIQQLLKEHRLSANLSQIDVAEKLGISRKTLQNWEAGLTKPSKRLWLIRQTPFRFADVKGVRKSLFPETATRKYSKTQDYLSSFELVRPVGWSSGRNLNFCPPMEA